MFGVSNTWAIWATVTFFLFPAVRAYQWKSEPLDQMIIANPVLSTLSDEYFTYLNHPAHPAHSVRIKKTTDFCDSTVKLVRTIDYLHPRIDDGHVSQRVHWLSGWQAHTTAPTFICLISCRTIVDYGTKHLFFYFFESRNDPATDDVVMWINGRIHIYDQWG